MTGMLNSTRGTPPRASPFTGLLASGVQPTLAEIITALGIMKNPRGSGVTHPEFWRQTYTRADRVFNDRADYRLWRLLVCPDMHPETVKQWGNATAIVQQGLSDGGDIQAWGILQVMAKELTKQTVKRQLSQGELTELTAPCYQRLHGGLNYVEGAKAGCAFARIGILDALQNHLYGIGAPVTPKQASEHAAAIERYLGEIDPLWALESSNSAYRHASPFLKAIDDERTAFLKALRQIQIAGHGELGNHRMVSLVQAPETFQNLACNLYRVRGAIAQALEAVDKVDLWHFDPLLRKAAQFARCAWLVARDGRRFSATSPSEVQGELLRCEHQALWRYSQALTDLGDYLGSAALNVRLLWQIPPDLALSLQRIPIEGGRTVPNAFRNIHLKVWQSIYQAGYEGPKWARGKQKDANGKVVWIGFQSAGEAGTETASCERTPEAVPEQAETANSTVALRLPPASALPQPKCRLNDKRLVESLRSDARWEKVLAAANLTSTERVTARQAKKLLLTIGRRTQSLAERQELLRSAFAISLDLGLLRNASWILEYLDATPEEILDFAALLRRATQLMPMFLEAKQYAKWQAGLAGAVARLPLEKAEAMTARQTFLLHEILTGRCVSLIRGSPEALRRLYHEKFDDRVSESMLREALDVKVRPLIWASGTVPIDALEKFGGRHPGVSNCVVERPTLISLVDLGDDHFHMMFKRPGCKWQKKLFYLGGINEESRNILAFRGLWYSPTEKSVPWPETFQELARRLARELRLSEAEPNWLVASVSASLAVFPLQDLILRHVAPQTVLSLVPNFTWASREYENAPSRRPSIFKLGMDPVYHAAADVITQRKSSLDGASVVLGHGEWIDGQFTVGLENGTLTPDEWLEIARRRLCIVHSCWGGRADERLLGDLGGLPWTAFASGCRLFCAPVCEVAPETAVVLHRHLTASDAPSAIGLRYLNAIRDDAAVSLYTLYGFADEPSKLP